MKHWTKFIAFAIIIVIGNFATASEHIERDIKRTIYHYLNNHTLNATYKIELGDKVVARSASGYFSVEDKTKLHAGQGMPIASCTKPMTAASILILKDRGLLDVNGTISQYLTKDSDLWPNGKMPAWAGQITLHQLLTHTSGLVEYIPGLKIDPNKKHEIINKEILAYVASKPLEFTPGKEYKYCNTGYVILGLIIEQLSKQPLGEFFKDELFAPLKMDNTFLASLELAKNFQEGELSSTYPTRYFVTPTGGQPVFTPVKTDIFLAPFADGGVISDTDDLCTWVRALHNGKVISKESYELMIQPYIEVYNDHSQYKTYSGYGMFISRLPNGEALYHHGGNAIAIRAEYGYVPSSDLYFAMLSNIMVHVPEDKKDQTNMNLPANKIDIRYLRHDLLKDLPSATRN